MNPYLTAIQALENCVKDAMENNIDANTQSEIWRHYQGIKAIAKQLDQDTINFNIDTNLGVNFTVNDLAYDAGQPIDFTMPTQSGDDIITFNTEDTGTVTVPEHEDDERIVL